MEKQDGRQAQEQENNFCTGILAHVDAGKTTLAEALLYLSGQIRRLGRVDHKDAFLDTDLLERERGITIFSKQAQICYTDADAASHSMTLLDTPGHADFSAETERTLQAMDYAVLVINGAEGVQGQTRTLWELLERCRIPVFLFVNKMDQEGTDRAALLEGLKRELDERCVDFSEAARQPDEAFYDSAAMCSEALMDEFLERGAICRESLRDAVAARELFPCYFGSALRMQGVEAFLDGFFRYAKPRVYPAEFGARVFKIGRDRQGRRLTYLKVTGGRLTPRMPLRGKDRLRRTESGEMEQWEEKADQLRLYSGAQFQPLQEARAGCVCAVTGLSHTYCGQGLGCEPDAPPPRLEPVMTCRLELPPGCDAYRMFLQLKQLEEEEPQLHLVWQERLGEIHAQIMGEVQTEVLRHVIRERFGADVGFGAGSIVYKETIRGSAEGVGHFEPLRHYAEVHLLLEEGERGSGLQFAAACSTDLLAVNWQKLVLSQLQACAHRGVLTGADITDMRITLTGGRAHLKHTEGGDFRQAACRALRQGLRMAESVLLEPVYRFLLEVPAGATGRAMSDLERMGARFDPPETDGGTTRLSGRAPVAEMQGYAAALAAYSGGQGRLSCCFDGYEPCRNAEEVIARIGYDPEADPEHPTGSVFCAHGAGEFVPWDEVRSRMHVPADACGLSAGEDETRQQAARRERESGKRARGAGAEDDALLEAIFERTYGSNTWRSAPIRTGGARRGAEADREKQGGANADRAKQGGAEARAPGKKPRGSEEEYLLVDGYNILYAWEPLRSLAQQNADSARTKLMDILCNYQGYRQCTVILVFDAYRVEGGTGSVTRYHNIHVVYTKEAETADQYIEKTVHEIGRKYRVTVATSDALEQRIIWGAGAQRLSAAGLLEEIRRMEEELRSGYLDGADRRSAPQGGAAWDGAPQRGTSGNGAARDGTSQRGTSGNGAAQSAAPQSAVPPSEKRYLLDHLPRELAEEMEEVRLGRKTFAEADFGEAGTRKSAPEAAQKRGRP